MAKNEVEQTPGVKSDNSVLPLPKNDSNLSTILKAASPVECALPGLVPEADESSEAVI